VLCCLGDKLDDTAVDTMLESADRSGSGAVQYEAFIRSMLQRGGQ
jgi:Ca2+-binding EF-hand superfamily protein